MNFKAIAIAAPLLAIVAAIAMKRTLGSRKPDVPQPEVQKPAAGVQEPVPSAESAALQHPAPETIQGAAAPPSPAAGSASSPQVGRARIDPRLHAIGEAIRKSYASTVTAFALHGEEADYVTHDADAERDADQLQQLFSSMRGELSPDLAKDCEAVIDRIAAAQLQLMAFAINRKNRGLPDSAQVETELADRKAFQAETAPHFERIVATLGIEGLQVSP